MKLSPVRFVPFDRHSTIIGNKYVEVIKSFDQNKKKEIKKMLNSFNFGKCS